MRRRAKTSPRQTTEVGLRARSLPLSWKHAVVVLPPSELDAANGGLGGGEAGMRGALEFETGRYGERDQHGTVDVQHPGARGDAAVGERPGRCHMMVDRN